MAAPILLLAQSVKYGKSNHQYPRNLFPIAARMFYDYLAPSVADSPLDGQPGFPVLAGRNA
jgi:hypothetical protein